MATKPKKGRGKTLNITEFADDYIPDDAYDWADDDWKTEEAKVGEKLAEKLDKQRKEYSRTANNKLVEAEGFRTAQSAQLANPQASLSDLKPPYVAHIGNLRNGISEEDFLELFNKDVVVTHRIINQDGKSFAFVEFTTPHAIAIALLHDGHTFRGRKIYVDLATEKQIDRLLNRNTGDNNGRQGSGDRLGFSRDGAGRSQPGIGFANVDLSRNVFGGEQQPLMSAQHSGTRGGFGSQQDLSMIGGLSRDILGSAVAQGTPGSPMGTNNSNGSPTSALSADTFANWRNEKPTFQPEFHATERKPWRNDNAEGEPTTVAASVAHEGGKLGDALAAARDSSDNHNMRGGGDGRGRGGGGRASGDRSANADDDKAKSASPLGGPGAFSNWRDEPRTEQFSVSSPIGGEREREPRRGGRGGGTGTDGGKPPVKSTPVAEKDWGSLRQ